MRESEDILRKMLTETREIKLDKVPYAFEKRIMSHIQERPQTNLNLWKLWSRALFKAAIPCFSLMILAAIWASYQHPTPQTERASETKNTITVQAETENSNLETIVMIAVDPPNIDD
jgi:magnesium-transporting ATPase (P-type)